MIDIDKYEGHTKGEKSEYHPSGWWAEWVAPCTWYIWYIRDPEVHLVGKEANRLLIQDAPLLLAEVKRLREEVKDYDACLQNLWDNKLIPDDTDIWDEVKELLEVD